MKTFAKVLTSLFLGLSPLGWANEQGLTQRQDVFQRRCVHAGLLEVPYGLEVKETLKGLGLFATKPFKKGDPIICGKFCRVPWDYTDYIHQLPDGRDVILNGEHFTKVNKSQRIHWGVATFMNHSCNPNSVTIYDYDENWDDETLDSISANHVAARDIAPGEEICTSYFEGSYDEEDFEDCFTFKCLCHAPNCFGEIKGLKFLLPEQQKQLLPFTTTELSVKVNPRVYKKYLESLKGR